MGSKRLGAALLLGICLGMAPVQAQEGQWTVYTVADGLDRNLVFDVAQDADGFIWAASKILNRFDGREFRHFPLGGPLYVDRQRQLWVGPLDKNMILRYDGTTFHEITPADGLPDSHVQVVFEDSHGFFWFGTSLPDGGGIGVCRYDPKTKAFRLFNTADGLGGNDIYAIEEDSAGNLWFGLSAYRYGAGKGISRFDGKRFTNYTTEQGLSDNEVRTILEDSKKNLWVGSRKGLCRWTGERFESFVTNDGISSEIYVQKLFEDKEGNLWIGTGTKHEGGGIYRSQGILRYDGSKVTVFNQEFLTKSLLTGITQDRDGNIWMAGVGSGLIRFDPSFHRVTDDEPLLASGVVSIAVDASERLYAVTKAGTLVRYDGDRFQQLGAEQGLPAEKATGLALDEKKRLWVSAEKSLSLCDETNCRPVLEETEPILNVKSREDGSFCLLMASHVACHDANGSVIRLTRGVELPDADITDVYQDSKGVLWIATYGGLVRYSKGELRTFTTKDGLANDRIQNGLVTGPEGHLWFAGQSTGFYALEGDRVVNLGKEWGVEKSLIEAILPMPGGGAWVNVWGSGLYWYEQRMLKKMEPDNGIFLSDIFMLLPSSNGHLWIGTLGGGVAVYDGRAFQSLRTKDGLANDKISKIEFQGRHVWLLSNEGALTRYTPRKSAPSVSVMEVSTDQTFVKPTSLDLTASQIKQIKFNFQGTSFNVRPEAMRYTWRLDGYDKAWQPPTTQAFAVYRNLPPGSYRFEVLAIDRDLNYSAVAAQVPMLIELPWYLDKRYSIPAALVAFGALAGLGWLIQQAVSARRAARALRQQLRQQEIREKEALAKKNAELEASYTQLESAHGQLAEQSKQLVVSNEQLQNTLGELRQTQSQLVHSEKMAALGTMVAGVAHEINNPVNFIHANLPTLQEYVDGMCQLIEAYDEGKDKDEIEEIKEDIDWEFLLEDVGELIKGCKSGTERISQIVLDLRNFSRKDESEMKPVDLHEGIDSSLTIVGNLLKGRVQVHKEYAKLPKVVCNAGQINQVVLNLIKNSADAIPGNGQIWIRTRQEGENAIISIQDSGPGIPKEIMSKIFDPFFTTKPVGKGTGLGLSVSIQLVEKHGGKLWAESEPGKGATFHIRLPIQQPKK